MKHLVQDENSKMIHRLNENCKMAQNFPEQLVRTARTEASSAIRLGDSSGTDASRAQKRNSKLMQQAMVLGQSPAVESIVHGMTNNNVKVPSKYFTVKLEDKIKYKADLNDHLNRVL